MDINELLDENNKSVLYAAEFIENPYNRAELVEEVWDEDEQNLALKGLCYLVGSMIQTLAGPHSPLTVTNILKTQVQQFATVTSTDIDGPLAIISLLETMFDSSTASFYLKLFSLPDKHDTMIGLVSLLQGILMSFDTEKP